MKTLRKSCVCFLALVTILFFSCNRNIIAEKIQVAEQNSIKESVSNNNVAEVPYNLELDQNETNENKNPSRDIEIETESHNGIPNLVAIEENVEVYDFPDMVTGNVIYTLGLYEDVISREITVDTFEMGDGRKSRWSKIIHPVTGWVFAAYLAY